MTGSSDHQPRAWPAFAVLVASAVGIGTLLIRARPNGETAYLPGAWVELMGLTLMGFVLLSWKDSRTRKIAVGVSSVLAAQLAGSAVYAFKRWVPIGGFGGGVKNIVVVRASATAMAVTMVIAGSACLALLTREGAIPRLSLDLSAHLTSRSALGSRVSSRGCSVPVGLRRPTSPRSERT